MQIPKLIMMRIRALIVLLIIFSFAGAHADSNTVMKMAETRTENSGLLEYLLPVFEQQSRYQAQVIAVDMQRVAGMVNDVILVGPKQGTGS